MLRVLVGPDDPNSVTVGGNCLSSAFHPRYFFLGDRKTSFQTRSSDIQTKSAKPAMGVVHPDEPMHEHPSKDLGRLSGLYPMQNPTFQGQPTAQLRNYGMPHEMQSIKSEDCSPFEVSATHSGTHLRSFLDESVYSGDSTLHMVHSTATAPAYIATRGPFLPSMTERETLSSSTPTKSSESCMSEGGGPSCQGVEWISDNVEGMSLSSSQGSSDVTDGNSTSTIDDSFIEIDNVATATTLPWPGFQIQGTCDAPGPGARPSPSTWDAQRLSNMAQLYGDFSSTSDRIVAANNNSGGLSSFDNDGNHTAQPLFSSYTSKSNYSTMVAGTDGCVTSQGCSQNFPSGDVYQYHKGPYRNNEPWQLQDPNGSSTFCPGQLAGRPFSYPRNPKNDFLIQSKLRGYSYKDIKEIGGFKEAESTLRGRFRTLTKAKEQRVRKPQWHEKDIRLLCKAVSAFSEDRKQARLPPKVSWKKVAQYIAAHGGSYHFGNATCKKKWCAVQGVEL